MSKEIVLQNQQDQQLQTQPVIGEMTVEQIVDQVQKIQRIKEAVMHENVHYGIIPGTTKPTLLKPGAEKLGMTFRIASTFDVEVIEMQNNHREYRIICTLTDLISKTFITTGVGSCSTMETKYRYRKAEQICPKCLKPTIIKGKKQYGGGWLCWTKKGGCGEKFDDNDPEINNQNMGRIEYDNPADYYNTCLKMAKKRAYVDGIITATGSSDFFTQDVEDMHGFNITTEKAPEQTEINPVKPANEPQKDWSQTRETIAFKSGKNKNKKWSELPNNILHFMCTGNFEQSLKDNCAKELFFRSQIEFKIVNAEKVFDNIMKKYDIKIETANAEKYLLAVDDLKQNFGQLKEDYSEFINPGGNDA